MSAAPARHNRRSNKAATAHALGIGTAAQSRKAKAEAQGRVEITRPCEVAARNSARGQRPLASARADDAGQSQHPKTATRNAPTAIETHPANCRMAMSPAASSGLATTERKTMPRRGPGPRT